MKQFDTISAAPPHDGDSQPSYFSNGLLSKIIRNDQQLARPTEDVLRRLWVTRMVLAEFAFVIGVVLLQLFPVIDAPTAVAGVTAATAEPTIAATATPAPSPTQAATAAVIAATAEPAPLSSATAQPAAILPVALPNTGAATPLTIRCLIGLLLCGAGGLLLRSIRAARPGACCEAAAGRADRCSAHEGAAL